MRAMVSFVRMNPADGPAAPRPGPRLFGIEGAAAPAPYVRDVPDRQDPPTTVVLVDDHAGFRREARALLELDGFQVIDEAGDGAGALALLAHLVPALVVLDVGLPDVSGLDLIAPIRRLVPNARIVLISGRPASQYGGRVAEAGADAYLEKAALAPGVLAALFDNLGHR
jgi:DNA-binding NarL/FixJ family response regulator